MLHVFSSISLTRRFRSHDMHKRSWKDRDNTTYRRWTMDSQCFSGADWTFRSRLERTIADILQIVSTYRRASDQVSEFLQLLWTSQFSTMLHYKNKRLSMFLRYLISSQLTISEYSRWLFPGRAQSRVHCHSKHLNDRFAMRHEHPRTLHHQTSQSRRTHSLVQQVRTITVDCFLRIRHAGSCQYKSTNEKEHESLVLFQWRGCVKKSQYLDRDVGFPTNDRTVNSHFHIIKFNRLCRIHFFTNDEWRMKNAERRTTDDEWRMMDDECWTTDDERTTTNEEWRMKNAERWMPNEERR